MGVGVLQRVRREGKRYHDPVVGMMGGQVWGTWPGKVTSGDTSSENPALSSGGDREPLTLASSAPGAFPLACGVALGKVPRVSLDPGLEPRLGPLSALTQPVPA